MASDVRVVHGAPDDVELAALVAGIAVGTMACNQDDHTARSSSREAASRQRWCDGAQRLRDPLTHTPDAWRWSARS